MEVVKQHHCALVKESGHWEVLASSEARAIKDVLKRTEQRLDALSSNMSEGFAYHRVVLNPAGKPCDYVFLEVNPAFEKLTGLPAKAIVGRRVTEVIPGIEKDPTDWIGTYGRVALTGKPAQFESHAKELERWYAVSAFCPHKGYFAVTFADITERKRAEAALAAEKERLSVTLRSIGDAVISCGADFRVTFLNPVAAALSGWSQADATGRPIQEVLRIEHETTGVPVPDLAEQVLREKRVIGLANHSALRTKDGRLVPIEDSAAPMLDGGGRVVGVVIVFHDVTEKRRAQQELRRAADRLAATNRELNEFAHAVSHDLKAPLRAASMLADWVVTDYADRLDQRGREQLTLMRARLKRMHQLIDDVLAYSRLGRVEEAPTSIDLRDVVTRAIEFVGPPGHVTVAVDTDLPTIVCDPVRLQQVFQNLIGNAVKHMDKPRGEVRVGCEAERGGWRFHVADNGPGIDPCHHERIFKIFQTLKPKDESEGGGVGLAIVRRIVEGRGGRVWVESAVGQGSTFYFTIPHDVDTTC